MKVYSHLYFFYPLSMNTRLKYGFSVVQKQWSKRLHFISCSQINHQADLVQQFVKFQMNTKDLYDCTALHLCHGWVP